MRGGRSRRSKRNIAKSAPTAAWDIEHRRNLLLTPKASTTSTEVNWGEGPQKPALAPDLIPLIREMEPKKFVRFLRERVNESRGQVRNIWPSQPANRHV